MSSLSFLHSLLDICNNFSKLITLCPAFVFDITEDVFEQVLVEVVRHSFPYVSFLYDFRFCQKRKWRWDSCC